MRTIAKLLLLLIVITGLQTSCSFKGRFVGNQYDTSHWCRYPLTSLCRYETEYVNFTVEKVDKEGEKQYHMWGSMETKGLPSVYKTITVKGTSFYLILAKDNTVVKTRLFFPAQAKINAKFPFDMKFESPPFDSYNFTYEFRVTDQTF